MTFDSYMYLEVVLLDEARQPLVVGLELPEDSPFKIIEEKPELTQQLISSTISSIYKLNVITISL